jgi:hypothetical protein
MLAYESLKLRMIIAGAIIIKARAVVLTTGVLV